jgi:hypothetical protein
MEKAKALCIILSGEEAPLKVLVGLNFAWRMKKAENFEDIQLIIWGPAQAFLANTEDKNILEAYQEVLNNNLVPTACINYAEMLKIELKLKEKKMDLVHVGKKIADLMANGYQVLNF